MNKSNRHLYVLSPANVSGSISLFAMELSSFDEQDGERSEAALVAQMLARRREDRARFPVKRLFEALRRWSSRRLQRRPLAAGAAA